MFKSQEEYEEMITDYDKFNAYIDGVVEVTVQRCMLAIPQLVIHHIKSEKDYAEAKDKFFTANPELLKHQQVVRQEITKVVNNHIDWDINQVFTQAGIQAKEVIRSKTHE